MMLIADRHGGPDLVADDEALLTVQNVSERLQVPTGTVQRWIRERRLIAIRLGGRRTGYRIKPSDLAAFVNQHRGITGGDSRP